jgi:Hint module
VKTTYSDNLCSEQISDTPIVIGALDKCVSNVVLRAYDLQSTGITPSAAPTTLTQTTATPNATPTTQTQTTATPNATPTTQTQTTAKPNATPTTQTQTTATPNATPTTQTQTTATPNVLPTTPLATGGSKSSSNDCFAGSETVMLATRELRFISDVRVGDQVVAADAAGRIFNSEVVFVPHGPNTQRSLFTHISTAAGSSIKMTSNHIIPAGPCDSIVSLPLVYATEVRVGDCVMTVLGEETVSAVEVVQGEGLYTIVTGAEYLVVNGIVVSPFGTNHVAANFTTFTASCIQQHRAC